MLRSWDSFSLFQQTYYEKTAEACSFYFNSSMFRSMFYFNSSSKWQSKKINQVLKLDTSSDENIVHLFDNIILTTQRSFMVTLRTKIYRQDTRQRSPARTSQARKSDEGKRQSKRPSAIAKSGFKVLGQKVMPLYTAFLDRVPARP